MTIKKKLSKKRPDGAGAVAPASSTSKPAPASSTRNPAAEDQLLTILKHNLEKATEPELKQRLHGAISAIEARRG
jgi:hypothetical protein